MNCFSIDQGNTFTKVAFFTNGEMQHCAVLEDGTLQNDLTALIEKYAPENGILSSVRSSAEQLHAMLEAMCPTVLLTPTVALPIQVEYETPYTLGADRKANAVAAYSEFGLANTLVVDCGTCITYTLVSQGKLLGGAISPGIKMRYKALHEYTGKLPHVAIGGTLPNVIGKSSEDNIRAGVELAMVLEMDQMIAAYCSQMNHLNVVLTGGSNHYFVQHLKSPIFARPFYTLTGLHEILLFQLK
jgi:type III pantothenate kinase